MIYISVVFALIILSFFNIPEKWQYIIVFFVHMFIFGGKYYSGWDWVNYQSYFDCLSHFDFIRGQMQCQHLGDFEIGFVALNKIVQYLGMNVQGLYFFIALIHITVWLYFAKTIQTRHIIYSYTLYLCIFGWGLLMQVLRQNLAVACFFLAIILYLRHRYFLSSAALLLGGLFHVSIYPFTIIILLWNILEKKSNTIKNHHTLKHQYAHGIQAMKAILPTKKWRFFFIFICMMCILGLGVTVYFLSGLHAYIYTKFNTYIQSDKYMSFFSINAYIKYSVFILAAYIIKKSQKNNVLTYKNEDANAYIMHRLYKLYTYGLWLYPILSMVTILVRFNLFIMPLGFLLMGNKMIKFKDRLLYLCIAVLLFLAFISTNNAKTDVHDMHNFWVSQITGKKLNFHQQVYELDRKKVIYNVNTD